jgi:hypothetical protein
MPAGGYPRRPVKKRDAKGGHLVRSAASIETALAFERATRKFKLPVDAGGFKDRRQAFNIVVLSMMPILALKIEGRRFLGLFCCALAGKLASSGRHLCSESRVGERQIALKHLYLSSINRSFHQAALRCFQLRSSLRSLITRPAVDAVGRT